MNRNLDCVKALESAGAELNRDSFEDGTPLELAVHCLEAVNTWSDDGEFALSNPVERRQLFAVAEYLATAIFGPEQAARLKEDWPPIDQVDPETDATAKEATEESRDAERQKRRDRQEQDREKAKDERDTALQEAMNRNREERAGQLVRTATIAKVVESRWIKAAASVKTVLTLSAEPEPEMDLGHCASSGPTNMAALLQWMNAAFEEDYDEPEDCIASGGVDLLGFFCDATGMTDKMDDDEELSRSLMPTTSRAATPAGATENFRKLTLAMERYLQGKEIFTSVNLSYIDVQAIVQRGSEADLEAMLAAFLCCVRKAMLDSNLHHIADEMMERVSELEDSTLAVLEDIDVAAMARATQLTEGTPPE